MKTSIAAHYFKICKDSYQGTATREAFAFPHWLTAFGNDGVQAQVSYLSLQATLLMLLNQGAEFLTGYPNLAATPNQTLAELCTILGSKLESIQDSLPYRPLVSALHGLSEFSRFTGSSFSRADESDRGSAASIHQLVAEACQRDAALVTPVDVAAFMTGLALNGLGLLYGARTLSHRVHLVGDEFGRGTDQKLPTSLKNAYSECQTWFRYALFANRQFVEFEWCFGARAERSSTLIVNAVTEHLPFFLDGDGTTSRQSPGPLNHVLKAGYSRVIVLVSNHFLTAGRGFAEKILTHCIRHGLTKVIQLPIGVLGFRSQEHSILVFEGGAPATEVEFIRLDHGQSTGPARKGFGEPRKANTLEVVSRDGQGIPLACQRNTVAVSRLQDFGNTSPGKKKLLSFEAGQFLAVDPLSPLRKQCEFMRIHEFMEVFRSHHIVETGEPERSEYMEIGASSIDAYGWIGEGRLRICARSSLIKRSAQILKDQDIVLCFRGSPDSFGKVGLYRAEQGITAVPNQSFVILRRKTTPPNNAPSAALLLWWLNSRYARECMDLKSITPDVIRISPKDIASLEVPIGPSSFIQMELEKLTRVELALQEVKRIEREIKEIRVNAWL